LVTRAEFEKLTILQIATINKPIKPDLGYSPIETVIFDIDKGLDSLGHRTIVACSADSRVTGEQYETINQSLGDYLRENTSEQRNIIMTHLTRAMERAKRGDVDIVQMHGWLDYIYRGLINMSLPIVMTLHVPAKNGWIKKSHYQHLNAMQNPSMHFVAISEYQKRQYSGLANIETIHHGIEMEKWRFEESPVRRSYLFSIGRITSVKGQDRAIEVARSTGLKLIIAGCVQDKPGDRKFFESLRTSIDLFTNVGKHPVDDNYYEKIMKPLLASDKQIIFIGEIGREQKRQWFRHARATLFPVRWGEPFGLVLLESMACGTPVVAFREGAVPEIIVSGKTGFVVNSLNDMIEAVAHIGNIDSRDCEKHVQNRFSITNMAKKYSRLYQQILENKNTLAGRSGSQAGDVSTPSPRDNLAS